MAKISNTTVYPNQSPVQLSDYLIGTDAATLATKTFTVQDLADILDGQVTLQEVLDAGNSATQNIVLQGNFTGTGDITRTGNIELTGNYVGVGNITNQGNLTLTAGTATLPVVDIGGGTIDNTTIGVSAATRAVFASSGTTEAVRAVSFNTAAPAIWIQTGGFQLKDSLGNTSYGNAGDILVSQGSGGSTSDQVPRWTSPGSLSVKNVIEDVHIAAASTGPSPFPVGLPVYVSGTPSGPNSYPTVDLIDNSSSSEMPAIGLMANEDTPGSDSKVIVNGDLEVNETLIAGTGGVGDIVYATRYDAVTAQLGLTYDRPVAANELVQNVGVVTKTGANGSMHVSSTQRSNDLPNLPGKSIFIGSNTAPNVGKAVDTNKITIDDSVTPAAKTYDIQLGGAPADPSGLTSSILKGFGYIEYALDSSFNLAIGSESMNSNSVGFTGSSNTAVGVSALGAITSGISNTAVGLSAGVSLTNTSGSTYLGFRAGRYIDASDNTAVGKNALEGSGATQQPQNCVAIGASALENIQTGGNLNTAIGISAGFNNSTGTENTYIGANAGSGGTTVQGNTAVGSSALSGAAGPESAAVGYRALQVATGEGNTALGSGAGGGVSTGDFNTLIGSNAGASITTGSANVVVGNLAQTSGLTDGVAIGAQANTRDSSVVIGGGVAGSGPAAIETDSVLIGYNAQSTQTAAAKGRGAVVIGANASSVDGSSTPAGVGGNIVIGKGANSAGDVSIAIGFNAAIAATGNSTVCIGGASGASGDSSVVIGDSATGNHASSVSIGTLAQTFAPQGTAVGRNTGALDDAIAIGFNAQAGPQGTSLGANSNTAGGVDQVAIGANATTAGGPNQPYVQFSDALGASYGTNTGLLQFPDNAAALAGGVPVGGLYIIGVTGAAVSSPAMLAIVTP